MWSGPLRVDNGLSNADSWREAYGKNEMTLRPQDIRSIREAALLWLMAGCGLRVSEAAALKVEHLDGPGGHLYVVNGKGGRQRTSILPRSVLEALEAHLQGRAEGYVFEGVNSNLKFLNSGKVKFLTCKFLRLILRSYVDANQEGVPHVERFVRRRFKHQRDCSTDRP